MGGGLPPQLPQNANFGIFCPILMKFGVYLGQFRGDLKENKEKSLFWVFYHPSTTPGLPPQLPQNANFGNFCQISMKFGL